MKFNWRSLIVFSIVSIGMLLLFSYNPGNANVPPVGGDSVPPDEYILGTVTQVTGSGSNAIEGDTYTYQNLIIKLDDADKTEIHLTNDLDPGSEAIESVAVNDKVVIAKIAQTDQDQYYLTDRYRLPTVELLVVFFVIITIILGRFKGLTSLIGLAFSILVLAKFVVPQIIAGQDPFVVCMIGALLVAPISLYLAHGFNKRTTVAVISTLISIIISIGIAVLFVNVTQLSGTGNEDAQLLKIGTLQNLNLRGLLLGGIIFGAVGILDDITTAQTAAVDEILKANKNLGFRELYSRGTSVGREHIASLVNTLVLAYVGSSFPILILFSLNDGVPLMVRFNSEYLVEEVVRTLVGSLTLLIAVPISTILAAYLLTKNWGVLEKIFGADEELPSEHIQHHL